MADKSPRQIDETKTAGASYIISFYNNVTNINHNYANYLNSLVLFENTDTTKLDEGQKKELIENLQAIRYYCTQAFIGYKTIMIGLGRTEDSKIEENYNKIVSTLIILRTDLFNYVVGLNNVLMQDIIKRLLESSQDIINNIYGSDEPANK